MRKEFATFELNEQASLDVEYIRGKFSRLADSLDEALVESNPRYKALMMTHLETACLFAVKAIASNYPIARG